MSMKKVAIIGLFVLIAGAAINVFINIKDGLVNKADEIVVKSNDYKNIEVLSDNASVEFISTKDDETKVEFTGRMKKKTKYNFTADVKGDTLSIELTQKHWNFIQFGFSSMDIKLSVYVPEKQYNAINAELDNGQIDVKDMQAKSIHLETDNGFIQMKNIEAETVHVRTDNGKILMNEVEGKIDASTDNGRIVLITNNLDRPISLSTDNGLIEIQTDKEPTNATIEADVEIGKLSVFGKSNKQTIFGDGDNLIKLETDNGKISVGNSK